MCTHIASTATVMGVGKASRGWFPLRQVTVAYDHATKGDAEHALLVDFVNYDLGLDARVALELDLESGRVLIGQLQRVIASAQAAGLDGH